MISQTELRAYRQLRDECQRMEQAASAQRKSIMNRLRAGERIEAGPMTATIRSNWYRFLNRATLDAAVGHAEVKRLLGLVKPQVRDCLLVNERRLRNQTTARRNMWADDRPIHDPW